MSNILTDFPISKFALSTTKQTLHCRLAEHCSLIMTGDSIKLRLLSYNCNGLKYIAADRAARIRSIADYILAGHFDVVCLQEIFTAEDYQHLTLRCQSALPFSHWFRNSSLVGSCGLVILARWPFRTVDMRLFGLNGCPFKLYRGDWNIDKAIGYVRMLIPAGCSGGDAQPLTVHLFNTHMLANYGGETSQSQYSIHRLCQAYELAHYIETIVGPSPTADSILILAGDLNTQITDVGYDFIINRLFLFDCHPCPSKCLCYSANRAPASLLKVCPRAEKIDYIMLRLGPNCVSDLEVYSESGLDETGKVMSDHLPLAVSMTILRRAIPEETIRVNHLRTESVPQTACLKRMRKYIVDYLTSQSYRGTLFALVANLACLVAFAATLFVARLGPLEATLLMALYLVLLYIVCFIKMSTFDGECKSLQRMLAHIDLDLAAYNRTQSVLLLDR